MSIDPRRSGIKNDDDGVLTWRFGLLSCLASCLCSKTQRVPGHLVDPLRNSRRVLGRFVDPLRNFQIGGNFVDPLQNSCYLKNSCCAKQGCCLNGENLVALAGNAVPIGRTEKLVARGERRHVVGVASNISESVGHGDRGKR